MSFAAVIFMQQLSLSLNTMNKILLSNVLERQLLCILRERNLNMFFQPILDIHNEHITGFEALARGPSNSPLHLPQVLFQAATASGCRVEMEKIALSRALEEFHRLGLPGQLFCNVSPDVLKRLADNPEQLLGQMDGLNIPRRCLTLEITEGEQDFDYTSLRKAASLFKSEDVSIALDDLGEGFSSLRLWSELRPEYVKIDKHFISGIDRDPVKLQFVKSILHIAEDAHATVIAEGVETPLELVLLKDLGVELVQGFLIGRPQSEPCTSINPDVRAHLSKGKISIFPNVRTQVGTPRAKKLLIPAPSVSPDSPFSSALDLLLAHSELCAIPVVDGNQPVGLIHRSSLMDRFSRQYSRELYGKKPCSLFMNPNPLIADKRTPITELSKQVVNKGRSTFTDGFILTDNGRYLGLGSGYDLMREITEMQIVAARYANPLTMLPGNVPIAEHTGRLMDSNAAFCAAYFDLDNFKPYNDVYGFRRGDAVIQFTATILCRHVHPEMDFVGHIGGDDFFILFQSPDWEQRCLAILNEFDSGKASFFEEEHVGLGGYSSEDRRGNMVRHPLLSLSVGALYVAPGQFQQHQEIFSAASAAKQMAKRTAGSSLFVEQRRLAHPQEATTCPA